MEKLTAPSAHGVAAVNGWLKKHGLSAIPGATNQWLNIEVPVSTANALLDADLTVYTNPDTGVQTIRTLAYSLPERVQPFIDLIYPLTT